MIYKVVERFHSLQGEGRWAGTPMCFVRLSQCPVGGAEGICTTALGKKFLCDTGAKYHDSKHHKVPHHAYVEVNENIVARDLINWVTDCGAKHLCITGGEPLIYDLAPIFAEAVTKQLLIHIETSGTIPLPNSWWPPETRRWWLTVSPKKDWLKEDYLLWANEIKILVDANTSISDINSLMGSPSDLYRTYLQPIEAGDPKVSVENIQRARDLCLQMGCRLSLQLHKIIQVR